MRNLNDYTCQTGRVHMMQLQGLWRNAMVVLTAFLLLPQAGFAQTSNPIGIAGKAGDFEIDADFIANSCTNTTICASTGIDWRSVLMQDPNNAGFTIKGVTDVTGENAKWIVDGNSGSGVSLANREKETFAGTSNKNGDFITLAVGATPYSIDTSNPSAPQKNDLTNIYIRSKDVASKTWLFMGAETRSTDGTSYLDFEYNQAGISRSATQMFGPISLASTGGRTPRNTSVTPAVAGDMLFVVDFSKGGGVPIPTVFEWRAIRKANKNTFGWVEIPIPTGKAFIVTNGNNVAPAGVNTAFAGDGSASNITSALQFVEMGVNISDIFGNFNPCAPEATMLVKTRTSSSYTSELKDFSLFNFAITPSADIDDIDNVALCPSQDATFRATVSGPGASASNVHWYKVVTADNPTTTANEEILSDELVTGGRITISTLNSTSKLVIGEVIGSDEGTYKAVLTGSTCGAGPEYATLTINSVAAPVVTLLEPSVCEARAKGLLSVCNPMQGANYYLEQLDANGDPIVAYHQQILAYSASSLSFELVPGYKFSLKVEKDGCEAVATCENIVETCPATLTSTKVDGGSSSVSAQGISGADNVQDLNSEKLTAYPVPFSKTATVEFRMANTERYEINLYDMKGNLVQQLKSGNAKAGELQQVKVDGQKLAEGMYLVRVVSSKGAQTVKLLKKE